MSDTSSSGDRLVQLAEEFADRFRHGERPSLTEYTQQFPDLAEQIRDLFPALVMMEQMGSVAGAPTGPFAKTVTEDGSVPKQLGEYRILREISRGGQGIIYEAVQEPLGRHVALKVLPFQSLANANHLERFRREARAAANLHHSNIVPVFGVGEHQGVHYYAMQFIQGQNLDKILSELRRLRRGKQSSTTEVEGTTLRRPEGEELSVSLAGSLLTGRFEGKLEPTRKSEVPASREEQPKEPETPENISHTLNLSADSSLVLRQSSFSSQTRRQYFRTVARLGLQVAEALVYAHGQRVLHRDIKPSNLLLDTQGTVWVTDFGLAKAVDSEDLTATGDILGTFRYMAPERFQGRADGRSDVYGLGATLYELLTLHPVHADGNRARLIERVLHEDPVRPRKLDPQIPRDLETVVLKAIAKEPERRYQSAAEFSADLKRFTEDKPIRARRVSPPERLWRWSRRNPALAWLTGSVAASLLAVAVISTLSAVWFKVKNNQLAEAERQARLGQAEALLGKAHGIRLSRRPGQRFEALKALGKAAAIGRELQLPPSWFDQLRNEAIAALALPDVHITREWEVDPAITWVEMNDDFSLYVCADDKGECTIHRVADHAEIARLPAFGERVEAYFGAGRTLGVQGQTSGRFQLWDFGDDEPVRRFEEAGIDDPHSGWAFRMDGRLVALCHSDGMISVRDTATGDHVYELAPGKTIKGHPVLHPSEPFVAVFSYVNRQFQVADLRTGAVIAAPLPPWPLGNGLGAWSPDGRTLTVPSGDAARIQQYAFDPKTPALRPTQVLDNPAHGCPAIAYNRAGDRFVSRGWESNVALFDAVSGRELFTTHSIPSAGGVLRFDLTGTRLAGARTGDRKEQVGLWSVADAREYRALIHATGGGIQNLVRLPAIHPKGRLAAIGWVDGVAIFDLESGRELALLPVIPDVSAARLKAAQIVFVEAASVAFDGAGNLLTNSFKGAFRWPVRMDAPAQKPGFLEKPGFSVVGPPERLPLKPGQDSISASADSQVIAQSMWNGFGMQDYAGGWILHPNSPEPHQVDPGASVGVCSVSPDGRWVAFAGGRDRQAVKVYEAASRQCVFQSPPGGYCRFTPHGRWLLTEENDGGHVYAVGTWAPGPSLGPGRPWDATSELVVLGQRNGVYRLVELATSRELARLEDPEQLSSAAVFTPDGGKLVANAKDGLRVWDLRLIRRELEQLGLDWDGPPYFGDQTLQPDTDSGQARKRDLQVEVDQGDLDVPERIKALTNRAFNHVRECEWDKAADDFAKLMELDPNEHGHWFLRAPLCLQTGNVNEYRRTCREMLKRFGNTDRPEIAERTARTCLLAPAAVTDLAPVFQLADRAVTGTEKHPSYWWFTLAKGLAEYRAGHYAAAIG